MNREKPEKDANISFLIHNNEIEKAIRRQGG
jgi:hypothetical protein